MVTKLSRSEMIDILNQFKSPLGQMVGQRISSVDIVSLSSKSTILLTAGAKRPKHKAYSFLQEIYKCCIKGSINPEDLDTTC